MTFLMGSTDSTAALPVGQGLMANMGAFSGSSTGLTNRKFYQRSGKSAIGELLITVAAAKALSLKYIASVMETAKTPDANYLRDRAADSGLIVVRHPHFWSCF